MSFFKYRVMKRLFYLWFARGQVFPCGLPVVKGQGTACETRSEKAPARCI